MPFTLSPKDPDTIRFIRQSWSQSWPMILIMFFEFLIGITDIFIAGRVGKEVQAAYGFVIQFYFVFIIVVNALTTGTVALVSQLFTGENRDRFASAVSSAISTAAAAGLVFGLTGILFTREIMNLLFIPPDLRATCVELGRIYAAGALFHFVLISTNGILRATRRVKASLLTMAAVAVVNVGLNFLLVFRTPLGFRGIALSTALAVLLGAALNLWRVRDLAGSLKTLSFNPIRSIIRVGWPAGLGQASWQIHSVVLFLILGSLKENRIEVLAAFSAGLRVESAIFLPALAFNMANAVIVGNLLGEGKDHEAFKAGLVTAVLGVIVVTALTILVIVSAPWIMPALSKNGVVVREGIRYLYISMLSEPFMGFWLILGGALMGAGDTKTVMLSVALCAWCLRIPLSYIFVSELGFGPQSVWWTMNLSQLAVAVLVSRRYLSKRWIGLVRQPVR
jgi:multidrug resistance protein, MATE family